MSTPPPDQQQPQVQIPGLGAQTGPLATIAAIVIAAVMQQYTAGTNHSTTTTDIDTVKSQQADMSAKLNSLNDQLAQVASLKATETQLDARMSTAEQTLVQAQADIKREDRRLSQMRAPNVAATPYVPEPPARNLGPPGHH